MAFPQPWRCVASVDRISIDDLLRGGVRCILIDRDNTCVPRDDTVAPPEILDWLERARAAGIKTCIVSNNFHSKQVERSARELGCEVVHHAMKPLPFALFTAMKMLDVSPEETVMIGDQIFTDVAAGNLSGVRTIMVRPQSEKDLWYTLIFRRIENVIYGEREFEE